MMKLYDMIENYGMQDVLERTSLRRRQRILEETDDDELIYYFIIGLTGDECESLFGDALQPAMHRMPPSDMFTAFSYVDRHEIPCFFSPKTIRRNVTKLGAELVRCCLDYERHFQYLLRHDLVDVMTIRRGARYLTLSQIAYIVRVRPSFLSIFNSILAMARHCVFPVRHGTTFGGAVCASTCASARRLGTDVRDHVMSFLVKK
jgi:hypothetical protein